jgi:hypothetical protein
MRREACLKPEYAQLYPGLDAGAWQSAGALADKVLACRLLLPSGGFVLSDRVLANGHFEFRGGLPPRGSAPERLAEDLRLAGSLHDVVSGGD